jgi:hypothetical protein
MALSLAMLLWRRRALCARSAALQLLRSSLKSASGWNLPHCWQNLQGRELDGVLISEAGGQITAEVVCSNFVSNAALFDSRKGAHGHFTHTTQAESSSELAYQHVLQHLIDLKSFYASHLWSHPSSCTCAAFRWNWHTLWRW